MPKTDDMLSRVPVFWSGLKEYRAIINSESLEIEDMTASIDDLLDQSFVETATWRMRDWEDEVGMVSSQNEDIEVRRARVLAKLSSSPPLTYDRLRVIVNQFLDNKNTEVFRVKGEDAINIIIPLDELMWDRYKSVKRTVEELIPSHIEVLFFVKDGEKTYPINIVDGNITLAPMIKFHMDVGRGFVVDSSIKVKASDEKGIANPVFSSEVRCGDIRVTPSLSKESRASVEALIEDRIGYAQIRTIKTRETQYSSSFEGNSSLGADVSSGISSLNICGNTYARKG